MELKFEKYDDIVDTLQLYSLVKNVIPDDSTFIEEFFFPKNMTFDDIVEFLYEKDYINNNTRKFYYNNKVIYSYRYEGNVDEDVLNFECLTKINVNELSGAYLEDKEAYKVVDYFTYCFCDALMQDKFKEQRYSFLDDIMADYSYNITIDEYEPIIYQLLEAPKENYFFNIIRTKDYNAALQCIEDAIELTNDDLFKNLLTNALEILN